MEEKVLIKSTQYNVKELFKMLVIICAVISVVICVLFSIRDFNSLYEKYGSHYIGAINTYKTHEFAFDQGERFSYVRYGADGKKHIRDNWYECSSFERCSACRYFLQDDSPNELGYMIYKHKGELPTNISEIVSAIINIFSSDHDSYSFSVLFIRNILFSFFIAFLLGSLLYLWLHSYKLTVTDKRVFGQVAWGKRVDLPVDSVSTIASVSLLKGISVSTSSGKIKFLLMKNANEIYNILNNLLIERQQMKNETSSARESNSSVADELKKYKELLDGGIISEAEFEAKKKQLLGL